MSKAALVTKRGRSVVTARAKPPFGAASAVCSPAASQVHKVILSRAECLEGGAAGHRAEAWLDFGQALAVDAGSLTTLVGVAGLTFILKVGGGLYWLIPAAVVSLVGGAIDA